MARDAAILYIDMQHVDAPSFGIGGGAVNVERTDFMPEVAQDLYRERIHRVARLSICVDKMYALVLVAPRYRLFITWLIKPAKTYSVLV